LRERENEQHRRNFAIARHDNEEKYENGSSSGNNALLRLLRRSNKWDDITTGLPGKREREREREGERERERERESEQNRGGKESWNGAREKKRGKSQPYSGNMFRNCFTLG
jgi:hypothetical protein